MADFKPKKTEKSIISIRIDNSILEKIDEFSLKYDISRNEFIVQCIDFALKNYKG